MQNENIHRCQTTVHKKPQTLRSAHISSLSASSDESSSSSSSSSAFLVSAALESSSFFFSAFSCSLSSFHIFAKLSASALSSVMMKLSKMVPPFPCHRSSPTKPKSSPM